MGDLMIRTLFVGLALGIGLSPAFAGSVELGDPVAGHPGMIWADVVRAIVPDLDAEGQGHEVIALPYLVDLGDGDPPPQPVLPVSVQSLEVEPLEAEGRTFTLLLLDLGGADGWAVNVAPLALLDEKMRLLDVINVGQDRLNALKLPMLRLSDRDEAVLTYSEHGNSNQVYGAHGLIMVRNGAFQVIDTFSTLDDHWCGHERRQTLSFDIPAQGPGYWPVRATITDRLVDPDPNEDCGDEPRKAGFEQSYSETYRWSSSLGQYVRDGDGMAALYEINESRY
jgi:hypothetical protein